MNKLSFRWVAICVAAAAIIGGITNALSQAPGSNSVFNAVWTLPYDSIQRTYGVAYSFNPASVATDVAQLCGNASNTVKVKRVTFSGRATAVSPVDIYLIKRGLNAGGTTISPTSVVYDANQAASQSNVTQYSANPTTLGTITGILAGIQSYYGNQTTGTPGAPPAVFQFGDRAAMAPTLRGINQCLSVNLSGTSSSGNFAVLEIEWTEE